MKLHQTPSRVVGMTAGFMALCAVVLAMTHIAPASFSNMSAVVAGAFPAIDSAKSLKLDVPYYRQEHANSCEAASLRMALAYRGVMTDDFGVLEKIGYAPRVKDLEGNQWDDPQKQFVGFADVQGLQFGYGTYGQPISNAAQAFGREAEYRTVITPQFLAKAISEGNPVVIWGFTSITGPAYFWNLPEGGTVKAFKGEHARLVVGMRGSAREPLGFYVHDPINGKKFQYWDARELVQHMYAVPGVTNQAVVIK